jgi:hypothetical protein
MYFFATNYSLYNLGRRGTLGYTLDDQANVVRLQIGGKKLLESTKRLDGPGAQSASSSMCIRGPFPNGKEQNTEAD